MFAVVRTGGKQYRVAPGDKIVVEKMAGESGDRVDITDVLLAGEGSDLKSVDGLTVAAEIIAQAKGDKVTVFKKRRRHNYRRKKGHRQQHTILRIVAIGDHKAEKKQPAKPPKASKAQQTDAAPTENPAPDAPAAANPDTEAKSAAKPQATKPTKAAEGQGEADSPSTKTAAPAKGAAKKTPKAK
jgi:large subunit ribosomal protein L21